MKHSILWIIRIVAVKELKEFFRDPRSVLLSLVLPLILFPLLFWVLSGDEEPSIEEAHFFHIGLEPGIPEDQFMEDSQVISYSYLEEPLPFNWRNEYHVILTSNPAGDIPLILYDNSDALSISAFNYIQRQYLPSNVREGKSDGDPIAVQMGPDMGRPLFSLEEAAGKMFLGLILPFVFFIFSITCPLPGAADLSSGEKERGSLEPLLSTAAPRRGIILGKLSAASIAGICSVCAYIIGILISSLVTPEILGDERMIFPLKGTQIAVLSFLLTGLTILFTAIEICAGFITRSVREAQLLAMPLLMIGMGAVYTAQNLEIGHKSWIYAHIPLVNIALSIKEAALDRMILEDIAATFCWIIVYIVLMITLGNKMFQKELSFAAK
ncbi:MAG: ABC transporter permease subunit [Spirochaetaceae bacterium]|jgi:sodium transport system permease protein|nr:ABC transporter permease subunit [Spirochaetaceae bacterium]